MSAAFADTFFWVAITNSRDQGHGSAKAFAEEAVFDAVFTTEEVLTEYLNYFAERGTELRSRAALNVQSLRANGTIQISSQSSETFQAGLALYRARPDKGYSLTDCISMATMRRHGIVDALTNDAHFEQEGFRAVFR